MMIIFTIINISMGLDLFYIKVIKTFAINKCAKHFGICYKVSISGDLFASHIPMPRFFFNGCSWYKLHSDTRQDQNEDRMEDWLAKMFVNSWNSSYEASQLWRIIYELRVFLLNIPNNFFNGYGSFYGETSLKLKVIVLLN